MSFDNNHSFRVSIAPMMDWTDRHCRYFHRLLSRDAYLYTEMVVADAIIHGPRDRLLGYDVCEHSIALQIGGSDPDKLAQASKIGEDFGYDEININIGCPSDRVQSGRFGACLMEEPALVAACFAAMQAAVSIPVTVKCRLGVDDQDVAQTLPTFIETLAKAGCQRVIIHARKAWLKGLSPKENRNVPPLDYDLVRQMKAEFPELLIEINGGLTALAQIDSEAQGLDGLMYGRAAYHDPWILAGLDSYMGAGSDRFNNRFAIIPHLIDYAQRHEQDNPTTKALCRHIMGLFAAQPGARLWRRTLSESMAKGLAPSECIIRAQETMLARVQVA